jgi:peptidoglycan hydrolase-like protein with peptidoglycan-binding domain
MRQTASRDEILEAQAMLVELGYHPGELDGTEGPDTRAAIRRYQSDAGHLTRGWVSTQLLEQLAASKAELKDLSTRLAGEGKAAYRLATNRYLPGDSFVYTEGLVETVVAVAGDMVIWKSNRNEQITAYRNFVLPPVEWSSPSRKEKRSIDAAPDTLWPLKLARQAKFSTKIREVLRAQPSGQIETAETWRCRVAGPAAISVPAGTFDTIRINCDVSTGDTSSQRRRVWYYAPSIGHYVQRDDYSADGKRERRIELVAIRAGTGRWPPLVLAGLDKATHHALENRPVGRSVNWDSSGVDTRVQIIPTAIRRNDEVYCRTFIQVTTGPEGRQLYPGKACRTASGQWHIPGLEPESVAHKGQD